MYTPAHLYSFIAFLAMGVISVTFFALYFVFSKWALGLSKMVSPSTGEDGLEESEKSLLECQCSRAGELAFPSEAIVLCAFLKALIKHVVLLQSSVCPFH